MKKIIYSLLIGLFLFFSADIVYGATCYYEDGTYKYELNSEQKGKTKIFDYNGKSVDSMGEKALNWKAKKENGSYSISSYGNKKSCPDYLLYVKKVTSKLYVSNSKDDLENFSKYFEEKNYKYIGIASFTSSTGESNLSGNVSDGEFPVGNTETINECEILIGEDVVEELNNVMFYIRLSVPILLLVFGALDFGTAVLSADDSGMKKAQGKFIKRLIIGIAIFFVPTIVNLIINIMNTVWGLGSNCGIG